MHMLAVAPQYREILLLAAAASPVT